MKNEVKDKKSEKEKKKSEEKIRRVRGKKRKTSGSSPDGMEGRYSETVQVSEGSDGKDSDGKGTGRRKMGRAKKAGILFLSVLILAAGAAIYLKFWVFTPAEGVKEISFKDKKEAAVTGVTVA